MLILKSSPWTAREESKSVKNTRVKHKVRHWWAGLSTVRKHTCFCPHSGHLDKAHGTPAPCNSPLQGREEQILLAGVFPVSPALVKGCPLPLDGWFHYSDVLVLPSSTASCWEVRPHATTSHLSLDRPERSQGGIAGVPTQGAEREHAKAELSPWRVWDSGQR